MASYPIFGIKTFHGHVHQSFACNDKGSTTLHHCNIVTMVMIISSYVVAGVATANYDCFLSLGVVFGLRELR